VAASSEACGRDAASLRRDCTARRLLILGACRRAYHPALCTRARWLHVACSRARSPPVGRARLPPTRTVTSTPAGMRCIPARAAHSVTHHPQRSLPAAAGSERCGRRRSLTINAAHGFTRVKRVFILGPSHHHYLPGCAVTGHKTYATPLGLFTHTPDVDA
jgi:hypothetical protein